MFAERFPRNQHGWIEYPPDADVRKQIFPPEVMEHYAKANLFMLQSIIDYLYKPGDTILDPMAGTGSIMIATLVGCKVICIDCAPKFIQLLEQSRKSVLVLKPDAQIITLGGDCRKFLPLPVDHIVFSPPYADILKVTRLTDSNIADDIIGAKIMDYSEGEGNIGMLPEFYYIHQLEGILALCAKSIPKEGTVTLITKDHIEAGRRVYLTRKICRAAERAGLRVSEAYKFAAKGTGFIQIYKKRGMPVVEDEDITIFRRAV